MKIVDLIGRRFGRLEVIRLTGESRGGSKIWECKCDCGKLCAITTRHLNREKFNIRSCGCLKDEFHNSLGKDSPLYKGYEGISQLFWSAHIIRSAKGTQGIRSRKPLEVSITKEYLWELYLKQNKKCALSGLEISLPKKSSDGIFNASVDRIDSSKGYIDGNVQWVHKHINLMKNQLTQNYFIEMCKLIAKNN